MLLRAVTLKTALEKLLVLPRSTMRCYRHGVTDDDPKEATPSQNSVSVVILFIRNAMHHDGGFPRIDSCVSFVYGYQIPCKGIAEIIGLYRT